MYKLVKYFTLDTQEANVYLSWFVSSFKVDFFSGVEAYLYSFLDYCNDYTIKPDEKVLEYFVKESGKSVIKKNNIKPQTLTVLDYDDPTALEESFRVLSTLLMDEWGKIIDNDVSTDFVLVAGSYLKAMAQEESQKAMMEHFSRISEQSFDFNEFYDKIQSINEAMGEDLMESLQAELLANSRDPKSKKDKKMRLLFKTGIPAIDGDIGGFYSKQLWALSAQPGGGKTRLALIAFVYMCAVVYKKGVLFHELELSIEEVENILVAHHIVHLFGGRVKIPDSLINKGELSEEQQRYVDAARLDLFSSGKYGRIVIEEKDVNVRTLKAELLRFFKLNKDVEFYCMDYVGLAEDGGRAYGKEMAAFECIKEVYKTCKSLARKMDIGVLLINQYTKEGIAKCLAGTPLAAGDIEGGQFAHRHSDYVLDMSYTQEQKAANMRGLAASKVRGASGFNLVLLMVDLSVSIFKQILSE